MNLKTLARIYKLNISIILFVVLFSLIHFLQPSLVYNKDRAHLSMKSGYYTIYRQIGKRMECLYVGKSDHSIHQRVNRWAKGVAGRLRPDENHSAATRARLDGVRLTDQLYIKYVDQDAVNRIIDDASIRCEPLDEWIAPLLKSKYNRRTFNVGLEPFFK